MRSLPTALAQKLDAGVTTIAQAWRLTRNDGVVVALTQHDRDLSFDGGVFKSAGSLLAGDHEKEGNLTPDRASLSGALDSGEIREDDLLLGLWDGAKIEAFWVDWENPSDFIAMWQGQIAGASWLGSAFELDVVGEEAGLTNEIGRVYARTCDATLGDARCKVDVAQSGRQFMAIIASVVSDRSTTIGVPVGKTVGDFVGGRLVISSGPAQGWRATISNVALGANAWVINVSRPFPLAPQISNNVTITMGCDKSFATCKARFANALNFRGQPTMPGDDVAFGGPAASGNDGGKR
jgi:uncharacterized phage protein (TIGR02218 family)